MIDPTTTSVNSSVSGLFENLVRELTDVFDAHGVCAAVASEIALYCQSPALVAISDPLGKHYDVWICDGEGSMKQSRWHDDETAFSRLIENGEPIRIEKFSLSAAELIKSDLWQLPKDAILGVPFPYPVAHTKNTLPGAICLIDPAEDCPLNLDNIGPLATLTTIILDRAFLRQRSDQQTVEFGIVSDISYSITSTLNLEEIFHKVADAVRRALAAESISIGLTDHLSNELVFVDALMGPLFAGLPPIRLKLGRLSNWTPMNHPSPMGVRGNFAA
jgi:hypothetical protein